MWILVNPAACNFSVVDNYLKNNFGYYIVKTKQLYHDHGISCNDLDMCSLPPFSTGSCQRFEDKIAQWDEGLAR